MAQKYNLCSLFIMYSYNYKQKTSCENWQQILLKCTVCAFCPFKCMHKNNTFIYGFSE